MLLLPYFEGATRVSREIKKITAFCHPIIVEVYIQPLIELGELMQRKGSNICNRLSLYKGGSGWGGGGLEFSNQ